MIDHPGTTTALQRVTGPAWDADIQRSIVVFRPCKVVYAFWSDPENLPSFMIHLQSVKVLQPGHSQWTVKGSPAPVQPWSAEILEEQKEQLIAWRLRRPGVGEHLLWVQFFALPGEDTEVRLSGCWTGDQAGELFGPDPGRRFTDDLRRLKWLMDSGR